MHRGFYPYYGGYGSRFGFGGGYSYPYYGGFSPWYYGLGYGLGYGFGGGCGFGRCGW